MYVQRNTEARSCNHCRSGKAMNIIYDECIFVVSGIQHTWHIRYPGIDKSLARPGRKQATATKL